MIPQDYTVIDLEMTGLHPKNDAILEVGAAKIRNGYLPDAKEAMEKSNGHPRAKAWYDWFIGQTKASFWIDNRDMSIRAIIGEWMRNNPMKKEA